MSAAYYVPGAMGAEIVDVLDVLAVIFGILFTVRKLDVSRREPAEFPHVEPRAFEAWRLRETSVYTWGSWACFLKVVLDLAFVLTLAPRLGVGLARVIGAAIDLSWLAVVVLTLLRGRASRQERARLGIELR
jgi:hypothetical protein